MSHRTVRVRRMTVSIVSTVTTGTSGGFREHEERPQLAGWGCDLSGALLSTTHLLTAV
jgi:hypothetical protein